MPTKRRVWETLSLKELQDIASTYELEVDDRRVRDQLSEAAGHSRKVVLAEVLGTYGRDRLKEICRALDLATLRDTLLPKLLSGAVKP